MDEDSTDEGVRRILMSTDVIGGCTIASDAIPNPPIQNESGETVSSTSMAATSGGGAGVEEVMETQAPGQYCVYVPPGNRCNEQYRLATFSRLPDKHRVNVAQLASRGFYYTGFRDRVKCFSCGKMVENWIARNVEIDEGSHHSDCSFIHDRESRNITSPITSKLYSLFRQYKCKGNGAGPSADVPGGSSWTEDGPGETQQTDFRCEAARRKTFDKWPSYPAPYLISNLAEDGFFYLDNLDRVQCFSCGGVFRNWSPNDNVKAHHLKHRPNCRAAKSSDAGNIPMADNERRMADREHREKITRQKSSLGELPCLSVEEQGLLERRFPCQIPVNSNMSSLQSRVKTFDDRWPKTKIRATAEQIAKAGFFFLGERDRTKCFYCNGGIQNWESDDDPWIEHAKWFPKCEFVHRYKGPEFVRRVLDAHPNLNRPAISNPVLQNGIVQVLPHGTPQNGPQIVQNININEVANVDSPGSSNTGLTQWGNGDGDSTTEDSNQNLIGACGASSSNSVSGTKRRAGDVSNDPSKLPRPSPVSVDGDDHHQGARGQNRHSNLPSGNEHREVYRRGTFGNYAQHCPCRARNMAKAGFYHTGDGEFARCFSCGVETENWIANCKHEIIHSHSSDCLMAAGNDMYNVPDETQGFAAAVRSLSVEFSTLPAYRRSADDERECVVNEAIDERCFLQASTRLIANVTTSSPTEGGSSVKANIAQQGVPMDGGAEEALAQLGDSKQNQAKASTSSSQSESRGEDSTPRTDPRKSRGR